jgi:hypothetical protein
VYNMAGSLNNVITPGNSPTSFFSFIDSAIYRLANQCESFVLVCAGNKARMMEAGDGDMHRPTAVILVRF